MALDPPRRFDEYSGDLSGRYVEALSLLPPEGGADGNRAASLHSTYMLHSTAHWRPLVNGYSGFTPASHDLLFRHLVNFPDERSLDALEEIGVRYAIVHRDLYPPGEWPAMERRLQDAVPRLRLVRQEHDGLAFELR